MIKRSVTHIVIHCAATPNGRPFHVGQIDAMHGEPLLKDDTVVREHKFQRQDLWVRQFNPALKYIGYHFFIGVDGSRASGRHLDEIGAHVEGNNARTIGICMAGTDQFTSMQWATLKYLVIDLARQLVDGRVPGRLILTPLDAIGALQECAVQVVGHRDFSPDKNGDGQIEPWEWLKTCPGFSVSEWLVAGMTPAPSRVR